MRTRVALIGAGAWATQAHAPTLLAQETVEVIGVVDPIIERARTRRATQHSDRGRVPRCAARPWPSRPGRHRGADGGPCPAGERGAGGGDRRAVRETARQHGRGSRGVGRHGGGNGRPRLRRLFLSLRGRAPGVETGHRERSPGAALAARTVRVQCAIPPVARRVAGLERGPVPRGRARCKNTART